MGQRCCVGLDGWMRGSRAPRVQVRAGGLGWVGLELVWGELSAGHELVVSECLRVCVSYECVV